MPTTMTLNERFLENEQLIAENREDIEDLLNRIVWEQEAEGVLWRMREATSPELYDRVYIDSVEEALTAAV